MWLWKAPCVSFPAVGDAIAYLMGNSPHVLDPLPDVPAEPGLYAWWAASHVLPALPGPDHAQGGIRLLYVGKATRLRDRILRNHLASASSKSTLRRSLAGLLMEETGWLTRRIGRERPKVTLTASSERELTAWMQRHLTLTWCVSADPASLEDAVVSRLLPPLNLNFTPDSSHRRAVARARDRFTLSASD